MKIVNIPLFMPLLILKSLCYQALDRKLYIDLDQDLYSGKIIEVIQYKFNFITQDIDNTYSSITHTLPSSNNSVIDLVDIRSNDLNALSTKAVPTSVHLILV